MLFSVLPDVIMKPRIIKYGTNLHAAGYPGENATLTCEAYGGLDDPRGLRIHFLRGPNVPRLIKSLGSAREKTVSDDTLEVNNLFGMATTAPSALMFQSAHTNTENSLYGSMDNFADHQDSTDEIDRGVERVRPDMDERHHLSKTVDPHNPYVSVLQLNVTGQLKDSRKCPLICVRKVENGWHKTVNFIFLCLILPYLFQKIFREGVVKLPEIWPT